MKWPYFLDLRPNNPRYSHYIYFKKIALRSDPFPKHKKAISLLKLKKIKCPPFLDGRPNNWDISISWAGLSWRSWRLRFCRDSVWVIYKGENYWSPKFLQLVNFEHPCWTANFRFHKKIRLVLVWVWKSFMFWFRGKNKEILISNY